jgi:hypothetical protein
MLLLAAFAATEVARARAQVDGHWDLLRPGGQLPPPLLWSASAVDGANNRLLVFGGTDQERDQNRTWALGLEPDQEEWTLIRQSGLPPEARQGASGAWDPVNGRMVVFGGFLTERNAYSRETWSLATQPGSEEWSRIATAPGGPAARRGATLVHQYFEAGTTTLNRMILFGGVDATIQYSDVWALELAPGGETWQELQPDGPLPPARDGHAAAFDGANNRMLVFGGWSADRPLGDLWVLDLTPGHEAWQQLRPPGNGPGAAAWVMAARGGCPGTEVIYLFGGYNRTTSTNEVWEIGLTPGAETWRRLEVSGARPRQRDSGVLGFDAQALRLVVFSGWDGPGTLLRDSWALSLTGCSVPAPTETATAPGTVSPTPSETLEPGTGTAPPPSPATPTATQSGAPPTATRTLMPATVVTPPSPTASSTGTVQGPSSTPGPTDSRPCPDAYEPDDAVFQARELRVGAAAQLRSFHTPGDLDFARLDAVAGKTYQIGTDRLGPLADTRLFLYASDGITELAANDDRAGGGPESLIEWRSPATGRYYVMATNANAREGSCALRYDLRADDASQSVLLPWVLNRFSR